MMRKMVRMMGEYKKMKIQKEGQHVKQAVRFVRFYVKGVETDDNSDNHIE